MTRLAHLVLPALLVLAPSLRAQIGASTPEALARQIDDLVETDAYENAFWGISVVDVASGETLYTRNARKSLVPASNLKLYTTAAALDRLGPAFRYATDVYAHGPIADGRLEGALIVRGSGDPTIGQRFYEGDHTRVFRDWADSLRKAGIFQIDGALIGDDDVFDDIPLGYGWSWDDEPFYYSAELGGLAYNENTVDFTVVGLLPGGPASITWEPFKTDYVQVENATLTLDRGASLDEGYARARGTNRFHITTQLPAGRADEEALTITNPTGYFTHVLRETLLRTGIPIAGPALDVDDLPERPDYTSPDMRRVLTHRSPPLREIVREINKESNNLVADQVLKTLGAAFDTSGVGSAPSGVRAARATFGRAGVDTSRIVMVDGSGLSRQNFVTPEMTVALLRYMATHADTSVTNAYYASLPIAGVDGTLEYRFGRGGPAVGNARAKTGYVSNMRTLSGYVRTEGGRDLAFSIMCNNYTIPTREVNAVQDAIVTALARYRR